MPPAAEYFIGTVNGELVCHLAVACMFQNGAYRATRLVVMPEWQGAGVGTKFLEWVCEYHKLGNGRCGRKLPTFFHTSHPQLIGFLQNGKRWVLKKPADVWGLIPKGHKRRRETSWRQARNKTKGEIYGRAF